MAAKKRFRYERELVDVTVYVDLGMTWNEAREFANFLDDERPAGMGSGRLAKMVLDMMRSKLHGSQLDRCKALAMIAAAQAADTSNCPF